MAKPTSTIGWIPGNEPEYIEDPGSTKTYGWVDATPAPNKQFNWFWNLVSNWINFVDEIGQAGDAGLNVVQDGSILFNGSSYGVKFELNTVGNSMILRPGTDNVTDLWIGTGTYTWKDVYLYAEGNMDIVAATLDIDSSGATTMDAATTMGITAGTVMTLTGTTSINLDSQNIILEQVGITNIDLIPSSTQQKTFNIGTSSYQWATIIADTSAGIKLDAGTTLELISGSGMDITSGAQLTIDTVTYVDIDATTSIDFGAGTTFVINAGTTLDIDAGGALTMDSVSTMGVTSGGAFTLISTGNIIQRAASDDSVDLDLGLTAQRYQYVRIKAVSAISFADSDSYGCQANFTNDAFQPIDSGETWDLGTSTYGWDVVYRVSEATPSELYFADTWKDPKTGKISQLNDLELLCNIKGRGSHDNRQGFELVDDKTLPDCILFRNKNSKEIEYNKKGQPFSDVDAIQALCIGAIRQLKQEIDILKETV